MKSFQKWMVWLFGDDRNILHPDPMPTLKCVACNRFVSFIGVNPHRAEWMHADDASPICEPVGLYRA